MTRNRDHTSRGEVSIYNHCHAVQHKSHRLGLAVSTHAENSSIPSAFREDC